MMSKKLIVKYFAALREQASRNCEEVETTAQTAEELYNELTRRYAFTLTKDQIKVAVNDDFKEFDCTLHQGDTVVFIPPVAGG